MTNILETLKNNRQTKTNNLQTLTNILQTATNNTQTWKNILPTTRNSQMAWLATLTALTLVGQYVLLGTIGLGRDTSKLPESFFILEKILWGFRGLVEIAVVVYVGMTKPSNDHEAKTLIRFESILISMIVLTVGPIWGSLALKVNLVDILSWWGVVGWGMGLAGISAVMLAAVAYAHRVQPNDNGYISLSLVDIDEMLEVVSKAEIERDLAIKDVGEMFVEKEKALKSVGEMSAELRGIKEAFSLMNFLPPSAQIQIVAMFAQGRPDIPTLAQTFNLSESTVRGVLARSNNG